jgi:hypothetical protein
VGASCGPCVVHVQSLGDANDVALTYFPKSNAMSGYIAR